MKVRLWRTRIPAERAEAYCNFLDEVWLPRLAACPENRGIAALRRIQDDADTEVVLISLWSDDPSCDLAATHRPGSAVEPSPPPALGETYSCLVRGDLALGIAGLK